MIRYSIPLALIVLACGLQAQTPMSDDLRTRYDFIKTNILKAADKVPEDVYNFQPTTEIRTFGQLIGHTADVQVFFCSNAIGARKNLGAGNMKTKAELVAALKASFDACDPLYTGIIRQKNTADHHTFEIEFLDPGAQAFAFTFG